MPHFCLIVFVLLLQSQIVFAQTGYKDPDTVKYTSSKIITASINFKTIVYYKDNSIRKITREFIGSGFNSTTIYYIKDDQLKESVYVSVRTPDVYFEEHAYFNAQKMIRWENTTDKVVDSTQAAFPDKEKLVLKFFGDDLKEAKSKKAVK